MTPPVPAHRVAPHHTVHHAELPLFRITRQEKDQRYVPGGDPIDVWTIYFTTRSGVNSWVTVNADAYNVDNVAKLLTEDAEQIERVHEVRPHG